MNEDNLDFPTSFAVGINLDDWMSCHNLSLQGTMSSIEVARRATPDLTAPSAKEIDLDALSRGETSTGILSPRFAHRILPSLRSPGNSDPMARIEIAFESKRRILSTNAPSRLSCMWLAEDSASGRDHIRSMFTTLPNLYIVTVCVSYRISIARADTGWFDRYVKSADESFLDNYWSGLKCPGGEWEFLLDGAVKLTNPAEVDHIRQHGAKWSVVASQS